MATVTAQMPSPQGTSNFDEISMQQTLLFSDSLKDLKNLKTQLYSAAEYFELSYTNDDNKDVVAATLKDYAVRALVNTVDHLGSVTYKVNDLVDEKVNEVSKTELRVSCIDQRLRTCQDYTDYEGRSQQSLVIETPKYHKHYMLPVGETMQSAARARSVYQGSCLDGEDYFHQFKTAVRATIREKPTSSIRKSRSQSPSTRSTQRSATFSFKSPVPKEEQEKRAVSPHRFPLLRTVSLSSRSSTPNTSSAATPNPSTARQWNPSELRKSASMKMAAGMENGKDTERQPKKGKRILKALLSRRKSKKDDMLYTYLDEY